MAVAKTATAKQPKSTLTAGDMLRLATDFADEHGPAACDYAYRAAICFEAEGEGERAYFWFLLLVMLGDIASKRIAPGIVPTIH